MLCANHLSSKYEVNMSFTSLSSISSFFYCDDFDFISAYVRQEQNWSWYSFIISTNMLQIRQKKKGIRKCCIVRILCYFFHSLSIITFGNAFIFDCFVTFRYFYLFFVSIFLCVCEMLSSKECTIQQFNVLNSSICTNAHHEVTHHVLHIFLK